MKNKKRLLLGAAAAATLTIIASAAEAPDNWKKHCALCHGPDGAAQTPMGKKNKLKDYTDPAVQAAMTDEEIVKAIAEGVKDDKGKMTMPAYASKMSEDEIKALVSHIRAMKKN